MFLSHKCSSVLCEPTNASDIENIKQLSQSSFKGTSPNVVSIWLTARLVLNKQPNIDTREFVGQVGVEVGGE